MSRRTAALTIMIASLLVTVPALGATSVPTADSAAASTPTATPTDTPTPTAAPTDNDIHISNPAADPDDDSLNNSQEAVHSTDPEHRDTDKDGLGDGLEVEMAAADPLRRDIFVEIDRTENDTHWFPEWERRKIVETYADAPIENPDGSTGVTIHINESDVIETPDSAVNKSMLLDLRDEHKDDGPSHHYVLMTHETATYKRGYAWWHDGLRVSMIDMEQPWWHWRADNPGAMFTHELGHLIGLKSWIYPGIDSYYVSYQNYSSTMNYNAGFNVYDYSDSGEMNDWQYLESRGFAWMAGNRSD